MDIKNKVLVDKKTNTYDYTLFCRKCRSTQTIRYVEKNQIELSRIKCPCSVPFAQPSIVPIPVPPVTITSAPTPTAKFVVKNEPPKTISKKKKKGKR